MKGILKGIITLDLTRLLPGPFCSLILANHGSRVIKVEEPGIGDYMRHWGPRMKNQETGWHHILNVNKESVTLNFKKKEAIETFKLLAKKADVIIEGFRPGVMQKLGLDYESLREINRGLIYCSISGYGQTGPYANKAGHDNNYLGLNGVLSYSGSGDTPILPGTQIADLSSALNSALGIAFSLYKRALDPHHRGEYIDVSLFDSSFVWNSLGLGAYFATGKAPLIGKEILNHGIAAYNTYKTKDGLFMSLGALEKKFWDNYCDCISKPEYKKFDNIKVGPDQEVMKDNLRKIFLTKTREEWINTFNKKDCCCEPIKSLEEVVKDKHILERNMIINLQNGNQCMGDPIKYKYEPEKLNVAPSPTLGQHTSSVLQELADLNSTTVSRYKDQGII